MKKNNKGFTLAELLIVVAIIAVLVAIAMPVFGTQLEKARCATDTANLRAAYGEAVADYLTMTNPTSPTTISKEVTLTHTGTYTSTDTWIQNGGQMSFTFSDNLKMASAGKTTVKFVFTIGTGGAVTCQADV